MSSIELVNQQLLTTWPYRVCLPYGVDLLQLVRWVNVANQNQSPSQFDIVVGERSHAWRGSDPIELFCDIQRNCINYNLVSSYAICEQPKSLMFFDMHSRFSFFSADLEVLQRLYPFSREIMWENFVLLQEEDDDIQLAEVFRAIQSAWGSELR